MSIAPGQPLPDSTLWESLEFGDACPVSPNPVRVQEASRSKRLVIFGLPGAFTPTCSAKHVPGYLQHHDAFRAKGIDEIWCVSVNDGYVMAAWGREQNALGRIRFLGDGAGQFARALGLERDLSDTGMGLRLKRFSMFVENGVVRHLNVEAPGKFEVSDAATLLGQLG